MKTVFFYGLFMDEQLLKAKGLHPSECRLVSVGGYGLRISERATLETSEHEQVFGAVMTMNEDELVALYSEKSVADYVPVTLQATDKQGLTIEACSYILPMELVSGSNSGYAQSLAQTAEKLGLPSHYVDEIKTWM